jgi:tetratricopeptide (TPR) repeat protein
MSVALIALAVKSSIAAITVDCSREELFDAEVIRVVDEMGRKLGLPASASGQFAVQPSPTAIQNLWRGKESERRFRETEDERHLQDAEQWFLKAVEIQPDYALFAWHLGSLYERKYAEFGDKALDLNPGQLAFLPEGSAFEQRISCLICLGRFLDAFHAIEMAQNRIPDNPRIHFLKVRLFVFMGRHAEAEQELREMQRLTPSSEKLAFYWSLIHAAYKDKEKALLPLQGGYNPMASYLVAQIYCALDMTEEALQTIREGIATGLDTAKAYMYPYQYLISNPYHDLLRQEQEYQDIVAEQKQVYDSMVEKYRGL